MPLSASHAHSLANLRRAPDDVVQEVSRIRAERDAGGSSCLIEGGIGTAFGCVVHIFTTRAGWGWPTLWQPCKQGFVVSTPVWPASAAARTRPGPAEM